MDIKEAVGVKGCYTDLKTGEELSFEEFYGRVITFLGGAAAVEKYLPTSLENIREKFKEDRNLNNISLWDWDVAAGFSYKPLRNGIRVYKPTGHGLWGLLRKYGITWMSCAQGVCILKEAARILLEGEVCTGNVAESMGSDR